MGFRGPNYTGSIDDQVDKWRNGETVNNLWHLIKRRASLSIEIGHIKREHRKDRCERIGTVGDCINAILRAAGMNVWKLLQWSWPIRVKFNLG